MDNVTVSAKTKFLVVALENVALLHSPKVLWNWITLQSLLKQSFCVVALENVAMLHSPKVLRNWVTLQSLLSQNFSSLPSRMSRCSILRRVTVIGNVTVSAKSKFLVVALENVALLHSPKGYCNW